MQWLFNLFYKLFDLLFGLIGKVEAPDFVTDLTLAISKYCVIANYYFPLDTAISVCLIVLGITLVLMIVSALIQIF